MALNAAEFVRIVTHPLIERYRPKVVVGGPGAWQLEKAGRLDEFHVDHLIDGEIERVFGELFRRIIEGDPSLPRVVKLPKETQPSVEEIPVVRHRSTFGVVEITRGCGRGCQFCSPATKVGRSFPLQHILASAEVNAREGATEVMLAGGGIKYPLWRFAGVPDRLLRKRLHLDFTGRRRDPAGLKPFDRDIVPGFETPRGLDMIDAAPVRLSRKAESEHSTV